MHAERHGRKGRLAAGAAAGALLTALFLLRPTFPNYDSYYTLLWGEQLATGDLPDYEVFRRPTPHPLSTLVAAVLAPLGGVADRALVLVTLAAWLALLALLFRIADRLFGGLVATVTVLVVLTRTDITFFALRGVVDIPFMALVFGALLVELKTPRAGGPALLLLSLAGLLRPEAWVLAAGYWIWLVARRPRPARRQFASWTALVALAPLLWFGADLLVQGDPLYSLTSTREVASEFGRNRGVFDALALVPDYVGANEKIVNLLAGGLGALLSLWLLGRRAMLPLALAALSGLLFLAIAAAGLSVIPRYLLLPSLILNVCVAVALVGWARVPDGPARTISVCVAVAALLLAAWRAPEYLSDFRKLNGQTRFVEDQHRGLQALLAERDVRALLGRCRPITVPTHSAIPVVRYETGLPKEAVIASIAQRRPPEQGLLLIGTTFNFEPAAARAASGIRANSAQKWWSNYPLSTFAFIAGNERWKLYARCSTEAPRRRYSGSGALSELGSLSGSSSVALV